MTFVGRIGARFKAELVGRLISTAAAAILTIALARLLQPDKYGLLVLALAILTVVKLFSRLGIAKSGARYITQYKEEDPGQVPHILRISLAYILITTIATVVLLFLAHDVLARLLSEPDLAPLLLLGVVFLGFSTLYTYARTTLQAFEQIRYSATVNAVDRVLRLGCTLVLVLLGFGAMGALAGYTIAFAISSGLGFYFIYRFCYVNFSPAPVMDPGLRRRIAEYSLPLAVTHTAFLLDRRLDTVIIGHLLDASAAGFYAIGYQVVEFVEVPVSSLGYTLSPTFGAEKASENIERISKVFEEALTYSLLIYVPAAAGLFLTADPMIDLIFGSDYTNASPVVKIFSLYLLLRAVTNLTTNGIDYLGRAKIRAIALTITSLTNIGLTIVLVPYLGIIGAAVATVLTYAVYTAVNIYIIFAEFELQLGKIIHNIGRIAGITIVMSVVIYPTTAHIQGIITLASVVALGILVWAILVLFTGFITVEEVKQRLGKE